MQLEIQGHEVLEVEEVKTETQTAIVKTHYDMVKHTEIVVPDQVPVGQEVTIQVACKNYLNEPLTDETTPIIVELDGVQKEFVPVNGIVEFPFSSELVDEFTIKTVVDKWRNDEKVIKVV